MLWGAGEGGVLLCIQLKSQDLNLLIVYSKVHFWRVNSLPAQCKFLLSLSQQLLEIGDFGLLSSYSLLRWYGVLQVIFSPSWQA